MLPSTSFFQNAAVDLVTGYNVDNFMQKAEHGNAWDKECFVTVVDAAINHRGFYYPLPTTQSVKETLEYPRSMALLSKAGVIHPTTQKVAENLKPSKKDLQTEFLNFCQWVKSHSLQLRPWLDLNFQEHVQIEYKKRMHGDTSSFLVEFWKEKQSTIEQLVQQIGVGPDQLLYTFDVMFRGLQYYKILEGAGASYFPHPIRQSLLTGQVDQNYYYPQSWSWGRWLANLIENEQTRREPEEIIQMVANVRNRVLLQGATWVDLEKATEKEKREKITTIANECHLPSQLKEITIKNIADSFAIASLIAGTEGMIHFPSAVAPIAIVTVILGVGGLLANRLKVRVPGTAVENLKFCRGLVEWPGLFS